MVPVRPVHHCMAQMLFRAYPPVYVKTPLCAEYGVDH
jgi:hypothetical protein